MTLQEILKSKGLTDEQIEEVVGEMRQNKIFTASEENLDIRYGKLKADHDSLVAQHGESTKLIEQFKAGAKDNEVLQGKIQSYESQIATLQKQLQDAQLDYAVQVALMAAKATDVDYMAFRLREKGELELDDQGHIVGIDDKLAGLKTQFPSFFESDTSGARQIDVQRLPNPEQTGGGLTKAAILKMSYADRARLQQENPDAYSTAMNH